MFGIAERLSRADKELMDVLDRRVDVPALPALIEAIRPNEITGQTIGDTAICLDSSVFLRLASHPKSPDMIDYLRARHPAPLILPGQAVQEFWNNQLQAVDTMSSSLRKKLDAFKTEFESIDPHFGEYSAKFNALVSEFSEQHGHVYDEATVRKTGRLFDVLQGAAIVPFVPRLTFAPVARQRQLTRTPPGFRDGGDGDFFIWADLLRGLQLAKKRRQKFVRVVLATEDKKPDWSRSGVPHPVLAAEVRALFKVRFEIWKLERLAREVVAVSQTEPDLHIDEQNPAE